MSRAFVFPGKGHKHRNWAVGAWRQLPRARRKPCFRKSMNALGGLFVDADWDGDLADLTPGLPMRNALMATSLAGALP